MPKSAPIITSFNAGEFSPLMAGRVDLKYYPNACRRMRNFEPTVQGPARRRPGTRFVATLKDQTDRCWLWRFEFNIEQAYVIEFGDLYCRFYANHGVVGAPFELVTPWAIADLTTAEGTFNLRFVQSGDVLYAVHPDYPPQKITRTGAATFTIAEMVPEGGPFKDMDPANTITVYSSNNTGSARTLTASSAIFLANHVGSLFYLEQKDVDSVQQWEAGKARVANDVRRSDGKNYHALNNATTGTIRPTHTRGAKYDGDGGVQWQFDDPGYGWCKITAIGGGGTTATVDIISRIPDNAVGVGNATTRWAHGAWSDEEGWPDHVTFFRERLVFARDRLVWQSVAGDFENFRTRDDGGLVVADSAITSDITSDRANQIEFLAPSDLALLIGTAGDESTVSELSNTEPFGPGNVRARKQSEYGARHVPAQRVGDGIIFAQKSGRKLRDMGYSWEKEGYRARDLTVLAEHVTKGGVIDMTYQQEPNSVLWTIKPDGSLVALTIAREQDVNGWHPHRIGGYADVDQTQFAAVESCISIPAPDGDRDEVWLIVRRYINGATKRYVEWIEYHHEEGDDPEDAFYVDSGLTLDNTKAQTLTPGAGADIKGTANVTFTAGGAIFAAGDVGKFIHYRYSRTDIKGRVTWHKAVAKITQFNSNTVVLGTILSAWPSLTTIAASGWRMTVTTISGLDHLEGQVVQVCADGASHPDRTVTAGAITLQTPASKVHVGLKCTAVLQPMPLEAGAADGTAVGKTKRASRCVILFHETLGAKYGKDEDEQLDQIIGRSPGDAMDASPPLFTGPKIVSWPAGYDRELLLTIVQDQPLPCTVVALSPQMVTQDNR